MLAGGYIRVYRKLTKWEWYRDANTLRVFLHLLLTANYEPQRFKGRLIERGQRVTTCAGLSEDLGISVRSVRTALFHLQSTNEVTIETTPKFSIITVKNYNDYQQATYETTNDRQASDKRPTNDRQQWKKEKESKKRERREKDAPAPSYDIDELEEINTLEEYA